MGFPQRFGNRRDVPEGQRGDLRLSDIDRLN